MPVPFAITPVQELKPIININVHGTLRVTQIVLRQQLEQYGAQSAMYLIDERLTMNLKETRIDFDAVFIRRSHRFSTTRSILWLESVPADVVRCTPI